MPVSGEETLFRIRDFTGGYMSLGFVPAKPANVTREERAHPQGPGDVFVMRFSGMVRAETLLEIGEELCVWAKARIDQAEARKEPRRDDHEGAGPPLPGRVPG